MVTGYVRIDGQPDNRNPVTAMAATDRRQATSTAGRFDIVTRRPPLAEQFDLQPHPEGGWFRETFRSGTSFEPAGYDGPRVAATAIYFLLNPGERSAWHVVRSDELWFWHAGGSLEKSLGSGGESPVLDGTMLLGAAAPLFVVPGGVWQAAVLAGASFGGRKAGFRPAWDVAGTSRAAGFLPTAVRSRRSS
jgi:predicted cupin superfamily sugar epimerase